MTPMLDTKRPRWKVGARREELARSPSGQESKCKAASSTKEPKP